MDFLTYITAWIFGFGSCYCWLAYRKQVKGIFNGGEIELIRKLNLK